MPRCLIFFLPIGYFQGDTKTGVEIVREGIWIHQIVTDEDGSLKIKQI